MLPGISTILLLSFSTFAQDAKPVSYYHDLVPVLKRSCTGCHHPAKLKGELDLTTHDAIKKGGKHGSAFVVGDAKKSVLIENISGDEPDMPKEGDPLSKAEVAAFERWIGEGAKDDTPEDARNPFKLAKSPEYTAPPVVSAISFSPEGNMLAVSGYHEVLLHKPDGSGLIGRLLGESPRIESITFSSDGKLLMVAGGAPSRFGEIQVWDVATKAELKSFKISPDSLYGASFSPDGTKIAVGAADKSVRIISAEDGKELVKFDNHSDWTFGALFTRNGKRILSCSRDKAMKLIDASNGQFIDDVNKLLEGILCFARNPNDDVVAYGGDLGTPRIYRISDNQNRGAGDTARDANFLRALERQPSAVHSITWSPDGNRVAVGSSGEARIYSVADGKRTAVLAGNEGAIFAMSFHPSNNRIATGGFDGQVRIFDSTAGTLVTNFIPVALTMAKQVAAAPSEAAAK
ncbi:MAG: c-type cytochrome domain-containing protein [Verrucomicrobiota bacterium]